MSTVAIVFAVAGFLAGWRAMQMAWDQRLRSIAAVATFVCGLVIVQPVIVSLTSAVLR
jgi:hypothetical protein